jgi:hypothetical protein
MAGRRRLGDGVRFFDRTAPVRAVANVGGIVATTCFL